MGNIRDYAIGSVLTAPSPATSGTTLTLQSGEGAIMPTTLPFKVTAAPPGVIPTRSNSEKLLVTAVSTDTLTITRAQGETTAKSIAAGWIIVNSIFSEDQFNASMVMGEVLTGTVNGTNLVFTAANPFSIIAIYQNGQRLVPGASNDYTVTGTNQITMNWAPETGSIMTADYMQGTGINVAGTNSFVSKEAAVGTINGSNAAFSVAKGSYVAGSLQAYVNGLAQGTAFITETSPATGTFTLDTAPLTGSDVQVSYQYTTSAFGNADTVDGVHAQGYTGTNGLLEAEYAGWKKLPPTVTLTYSSYSSTTKMGAITTSVDLTGYISKGNRIWLTQTGSIYGIVQYLTSTTLYVFFGQSYTLANATITNPYISREYSPYGFDPAYDIWSLYVKDTTDRLQSATASTWYVPTGSTLNLTAGQGKWRLWYEVSPRTHATSAAWLESAVTLSTTTNSETDTDMTVYGGEDVASGGTITMTAPAVCEKVVDNSSTSTTTFTMLHKANSSSGTLGTSNGFKAPSKLRIVSAYI